MPSPHSPAMLVSEGAEDFLPHSPVDYLNISSDILDGGMEGQVYQNVIHPESEYLNYRFVPSPKPTNHLGIFTAITSSDQTDECMRVKVRDRGELLAESKEWWYMRIDGEEGWTPKEIWEPTVSGSLYMYVCVVQLYVVMLASLQHLNCNVRNNHKEREGAGEGEGEEGKEKGREREIEAKVEGGRRGKERGRDREKDGEGQRKREGEEEGGEG